MIQLLGRVPPVQISPRQALAIATLLAVLVLAIAGGLLLEALLSEGAALAFRLAGRKPPRKSPARMALDDLDARIRARNSDRH
jgi:hypothetical protein